MSGRAPDGTGEVAGSNPVRSITSKKLPSVSPERRCELLNYISWIKEHSLDVFVNINVESKSDRRAEAPC